MFRPKSRVRHVDAPDLSIIEPGSMTWLADSRNVVCLLGCGTRIPIGDRTLMAAAMTLHREDCHAP